MMYYTSYARMVGVCGIYSDVDVLVGRGGARTTRDLRFVNNSNTDNDLTCWGLHGHDALMMFIKGLLTIASSELQVNARGGCEKPDRVMLSIYDQVRNSFPSDGNCFLPLFEKPDKAMLSEGGEMTAVFPLASIILILNVQTVIGQMTMDEFGIIHDHNVIVHTGVKYPWSTPDWSMTRITPTRENLTRFLEA